MTDQEATDQQDFSLHEWKSGSPGVFKEFFFRQYPVFFAFAHSLLGDCVTARAIATEALFVLWKKRSDLDSLVNCKAFLYTTIRNSSLNYLKYLQQYPAAKEEGYQADADQRPYLPAAILKEILGYAQTYKSGEGDC